MDPFGGRSEAAELLAATRELVAVNRQIAASLANLERLYAQEVERTAEQRERVAALTARLNNPSAGWGFYLFMLAMMALVFFR